ncbi:Crp/Fnr family transcriptional regulator [Streptomyces sp. NPDC093510]|uniref:Crp/Fnr family transcriptional regulator n=1 Tax=Streptomyces sp. NPDC093510 TaxID=3155199 RepID=UPI0034200883
MAGASTRHPLPATPWPHGTFLADLAAGSATNSATAALLAAGTPRSYAPHEILLAEGHTETFVLLLLTGVTKVTTVEPGGETALLAVRLGGDLVGEFAAFDNQPRSATVTAASPVRARRLSQQVFLRHLDGHPAVALAVSRTLVRKNRWSLRRRSDFSSCPVATRVARVLADLAEDYGQQRDDGALSIPGLTQAELAGLVGARERSVHEVLGALAAQQVIDVGYRRVTVRSLDGLREATEPPHKPG